MSVTKKILVTGAAGYAGSTLVPLLLDSNYHVRAADKVAKQSISYFDFSNPNLDYIEADLTGNEAIKQSIEGVDLIIHLAGLVGENICRNNLELTKEINIGMVEKLNDLRAGKKIIYISSTSVYGGNDKLICDENTPPDPQPDMIYAQTKLAGEKIIFQKGNCIILRPATIFGYAPAVNFNPLVNNFVWQAVKNKKLEIYDDSLARTFVHVRDLAEAILLMVNDFDKHKGEIFNVGSNDMNYTKKQVGQAVQRVVGCELETVDGGVDPDKRDFMVVYDKIAKAGYRAKFSLIDGITEIARMLEKN